MKNQETEIQQLITEHRLALSRISHEIRNPVTLINSSMQIIEAEHPEVNTFAFWPEMKEDMAFLRHLLDAFSGYNNGDRLNVEEIMPAHFFAEIASGAMALSCNPQILFTHYIEPELPVLWADPTKLRQAVTNLIRNAFESGASKVDFQCLSCHGKLQISVKDNGCGIEKEAEADLLTPFVTHKKNGTGLGLSIVKRIVDAHCGQLSFSSGKEGTVFTLLLPTNTAASKNPAAMPPK